MNSNLKAKFATAATLCASLLSVFAVQAQAATLKLTTVYCESDGTDGLPPGGIDQFINVPGRGLCLNFGEKTQDPNRSDCWIGARLDNSAGLPINNVKYRLYNFKKSWADRLWLLMYFRAKNGDTVYAYASASAPSSSKALANGDTELSFNQAAWTTIPSGVSLSGGTIKSLQTGMFDSFYYTPATFTMYGVSLNGTAVVPNPGAPIKDCTF